LHRWIFALILVVLAFARPAAAATADAKSVCFGPKDIPSTYHVKYSADYDHTAIYRKLTAAQRVAYPGLVSMYMVLYEKKPATQMFWLSCSSTLFTTSSAASHFFDAPPAESGQPKASDATTITSVGTKARSWLFKVSDPGAAPTVKQFEIEFVRGKYLIEVATYGQISGFTTTEGTKLAQLVDKRIQEATARPK
jgi:hypothetical protein